MDNSPKLVLAYLDPLRLWHANQIDKVELELDGLLGNHCLPLDLGEEERGHPPTLYEHISIMCIKYPMRHIR